MIFVALVLLVLVTLVVCCSILYYFYDTHLAPPHVGEPQVCGVMEFDNDPIERAVFLKKAPFKSKQTKIIHKE